MSRDIDGDNRHPVKRNAFHETAVAPNKMKTDVKWLLQINIVAIFLYAFFSTAILVADVWIFPKLGLLTPPPAAVEVAIRQGEDMGVLRDVALVLFDHVTDQARAINQVLDSGIFWTRLHFLGAFGLACINVGLLIRLRKSMS